MASSSTPEKTTKNSASERFVSLTDENVERFVEAEANKNTQRNAQRRSAIVTFRGLALHRKKTSEKLIECTRKNDE